MCEVIAGVGGFGVAVEESAALEIVGARLERHVGDRAAGSPELGVVVARRNADGFECVRRGDDDRHQARLVVVVEPFDQRVVRHARLTVDLGAERVL
jgi:hypothetical protein